MKKYLLAIALLLLPCWLKAADSNVSNSPEDQELKYFPMMDFTGGMDTYDSSLVIPNNTVQNSLNMYFSQHGQEIYKRKGYSLYATTAPVSYAGMWSYTDPSNNQWMITRASDTIRASKGNGLFTVTICTCPTTQQSVVSAVQANGNIFFVDQIQGVYYWNGTNVAYSTGSPAGSVIAAFNGRVWVGGLAYPNQNQLYASAYLDGTTWATGALTTSPQLFTLGLNDKSDGITAMFAGYNGTLYVFKNLTIWSVQGFDPTNFVINTIGAEAGCVDQGSLQNFKGFLTFVSRRGQELFDGYNTYRISDHVKDRYTNPILVGSGFSQLAYNQNTTTQFNTGTLTNIDTTTVSNSMQLLTYSSVTLQDNCYGSDYSFDASTTVGPGSGSSYLTAPSYMARTIIPSSSYIVSSATIRVAIPSYNSGDVLVASLYTNGLIYYYFNGGIGGQYLGPQTLLASSSSSTITTASVQDVSVTFPNVSLTQGTTYWLTLGVYYSTGTPEQNRYDPIHWYYPNPTCDVGSSQLYVDSPYDNQPNSNGKYKYKLFSPVTPYYSTGSYITSIIDLGSTPTIFNSFTTNGYAPVGSTLTYSICTSANSNMSSDTCLTQAANSTILNAVARYAVIYATFTSNGSVTPTLSNFSLGYSLGKRSPSMASIVWDNRYWVAIETNTADGVNDAVMVMDFAATNLNPTATNVNPVWGEFDIHAGAFCIYNLNMYHADDNPTGNVYLDHQGYSDNGNAINAFIQTKDYAPDGFVNDKIFDSIYVMADALGPYNLSTTYEIERNTSNVYSLSAITQNESTGYIEAYIPFPLTSNNQTWGRTISFTFQNNTVNQPLQLYGGILAYSLRPAAGGLNGK